MQAQWFWSIILTFFSSAVMSYISMATPIGPWIAITIVFLGLLIFYSCTPEKKTEALVSVTVAASLGGIIATACGFSFPTLYFLDPVFFDVLIARPLFFIPMLAGLIFVGSLFGMWIATVCESLLMHDTAYPFPVAQLIYTMINTAHMQLHAAKEFVLGCGATVCACAAYVTAHFRAGIPLSITIWSKQVFTLFTIPALIIDVTIMPMIIAIGFVTGHVIALPLLLGASIAMGILEPVHHLFFPSLSAMECSLAFGSGMVLVGAFSGAVSIIKKWYKHMSTGEKKGGKWLQLHTAHIIQGCVIVGAIILFLHYIYAFPLALYPYLIICAGACTYEVLLIAGKIGLAQMGRFATFVMVPAMLMFSLNAAQLTCIATFVELCTGVAVDILCGRKIGLLTGVSRARIVRYQYLGLIVSACAVSLVFWLLVSHVQLGSPLLYAYRAQARQLLIYVRIFDYRLLAIGALCGAVLQQLRINAGLVLGGLLMPLNISVGLIAGGFLGMSGAVRERWQPLFSGIFAGNSLWMFIQALMKMYSA